MGFLGDFHQRHGRAKDAVYLFENSLERTKDLCEPDSNEANHFKDVLGFAHQTAGDYTQAVKFSKRLWNDTN